MEITLVLTTTTAQVPQVKVAPFKPPPLPTATPPSPPTSATLATTRTALTGRALPQTPPTPTSTPWGSLCLCPPGWLGSSPAAPRQVLKAPHRQPAPRHVQRKLAAAPALGSNLALPRPRLPLQLRATEHKMQIGPPPPPNTHHSPNRQTCWRPPFSDAACTLIVFHGGGKKR